MNRRNFLRKISLAATAVVVAPVVVAKQYESVVTWGDIIEADIVQHNKYGMWTQIQKSNIHYYNEFS
jgi:hypothetical protein